MDSINIFVNFIKIIINRCNNDFFTALGAIATFWDSIEIGRLFILKFIAYFTKRPIMKIDIIDEFGSERNICYYFDIKNDKGELIRNYLLFFRLKIFQYGLSSILAGLELHLIKDNDTLAKGEINHVVKKHPYPITRKKRNLLNTLKYIIKENILTSRELGYKIEGCLNEELMAYTSDSEIRFEDPVRENIYAEFYLNLGIKEFGPYKLKFEKINLE